jgi:hypothetical protein
MQAGWLMHTLGSNMRKAVLVDLIDQIPVQYRNGFLPAARTNADRIDLIRAARQTYYDDPDRPKKPRKRDRLCQVTASECNEWLRSLPPYTIEGK